ncbi:glycine--tRNA ligase subunit alpha [Candidatus Cyrtobacter comes]|nr:glycine--tRNA ligase subunit alpha [Candidatus Cyrtobacter comes]
MHNFISSVVLKQMNFQDIILNLQRFWADEGCVVLQPYDTEVGAGTSHPATTIRCLSEINWDVCYVQGCRRPQDGRYAQNPNRLQHYYQFQVILKPSRDNAQSLYLESLKSIGINPCINDIRFIEDDWANPTLGAWGLGWEVWCNGMEITQFTYMQQIAGISCSPVPVEITYGLERIAMHVQKKDTIWDIIWNKTGLTYKDIFLDSEKQSCAFNFEYADTEILKKNFEDLITQSTNLLSVKLTYPAYEFCLKASHTFNILEARKVLGVTERAHYISRLRKLSKECCGQTIGYTEKQHESGIVQQR